MGMAICQLCENVAESMASAGRTVGDHDVMNILSICGIVLFIIRMCSFIQ
jgi:hypothetical protein